MGKLKLIDVIWDWKEMCEDFEVEPNTLEGFMEFFELTGDIMLEKCGWNDVRFDGDIDFNFYCGPSIGDACVSDSVYFNDYLKNIFKELEINYDGLDAAENYHMFTDITDVEVADELFEKIKSCIEKDFKIDIDIES